MKSSSTIVQRIFRKLRRASVTLPGGLSFVKRLRRHSVTIVMYHGVLEKQLPVFNWCQLDRDQFERQIAFLSSQYRIYPLLEIIERVSKKLALPENVACITFDDGFRSVLRTAYPILSKFQAPATVFLVTSLIGGSQPPWPERLYWALSNTEFRNIQLQGTNISLVTRQDRALAFIRISSHLMSLPVEQKEVTLQELLSSLKVFFCHDDGAPLAMLSWKDVEKLSATGLISFGSHTHTHQILSRCNSNMQWSELLTSRNVMLEHLGRADMFAYPNGTAADFTSDTKQLLSRLGYQCALTTIRGVNTPESDIYELRRNGVGANMSLKEFQAGMLG
jgi:peptidoglycan/xylan/chitin deacetylase (PgdA/CDA1 family)